MPLHIPKPLVSSTRPNKAPDHKCLLDFLSLFPPLSLFVPVVLVVLLVSVVLLFDV